jgi:UDP-glucose 4-epimerase
MDNKPVTIYGDGNTIRDYIYIDDFVFYVRELIRKSILNETINIGSGMGASINQIIDMFNQVVGHEISVEYVSARGDDVPMMILDTTRLHNFVHHVNVPLLEGIKNFYLYSIAGDISK